MNSEPFEPFDPFNPFDPFEAERGGASPAPACARAAFFDRAGVAWISACVALATVAAYGVPRLAEPGMVARALAAVGWSSSPETVPEGSKRKEMESSAKRGPVRKLPLGML